MVVMARLSIQPSRWGEPFLDVNCVDGGTPPNLGRRSGLHGKSAAAGLTLVVEWAPNCPSPEQRYSKVGAALAIGTEKEGREDHARGDLRLHRHRSGIGRLRGGGTLVGVGALSGAAARGRPSRPPSLDPHPHRLSQALHARGLQLEV